MDVIRHRFQEFPGRLSVCFVHQLRHGKFAGSVNRNKEIEFAFVGAQLSNIDMEISPLSEFTIRLPGSGWGSV